MFFAVSIASIIFLFGLGYLPAKFLRLDNEKLSLTEKFPLILTNGFLVNYLILLLCQTLKLSLLLGIVISACGFILFVMEDPTGLKSVHKKFRISHFMILVFLLFYFFTILCEPLNAWDARSIWFLPAKMIWSAESINLNAGWHHPSLQFSHPDYPKLIPALTAQISCVLGYWNEYSPKLSLVLILIPSLFWVFSFYSRSLSFLFLVMVFPLGMQGWLWNGYMDGYIALYSAMSMLLLGRYFKHRSLSDLMSALSCLALISNIKNEGIVIALIGMMSIIVTDIISNRFNRDELKKIFSMNRVVWLMMIAAPCILWSVVYKNLWGLTNHLQMGKSETLLRLINNLSDGKSIPLILERTLAFKDTSVSLSLIAFAVAIALLTASKRYNVSWIPALITAVVYYSVMIFVYLLTPKLEYFLSHSVERIMLTVSSCIIAGIYFLLNEFEEA